MKIKIYDLLVSVVTIVYGCSTPAYVEKDVNTNLSDYKTYMWVETKASESDISAKSAAFADLSVHNSVNTELQRWGWKEVSDNPDVLVSYDVLVERGVEVQRDPVYSQPFTRLYYNPHRRRWSTIYFPSEFLGYQHYQVPVKDATITITMMDADTDKKNMAGLDNRKIKWLRHQRFGC